jgi:hypothetical protein
MDLDPDPAISVNGLQHANKKLIFRKKFFCLLLFEGTFTKFFYPDPGAGTLVGTHPNLLKMTPMQLYFGNFLLIILF